MKCNKCNTENKCGCKKPTFNACKTKLDLTCVYYNSDDLPLLGVIRGMDGETILKKIEKFLEKLENLNEELEITPEK